MTREEDWGEPRPDWPGPRERLAVPVPAEIADALRRLARSEGLTVGVLMQNILVNAVSTTSLGARRRAS